LLLFFVLGLQAQTRKPQFVVLICSYNNARWYQANVLSVLSQTYSDYRVIYIDDCSSDGTADLVEELVNFLGFKSKVTIIRNSKRKLKMQNMYEVIHTLCKPEEIIVELDGDDMLATCTTLATLSTYYKNNDTLMTYGSYINFPYKGLINTSPLPKEIIASNAVRKHKWVTSHLKSYYTWLFNMIPEDHLKVNGKFVPMTADLAYMFSMLELAGPRAQHCKEIMYIYNTTSPINDDKVNIELQESLAQQLRFKKPLKPLSTKKR
jgi:glycosyltransferase involved in cell wall biosynthesis